MNEEKSYIPTLTLEPTAEAVVEAAAPAEEEVKKDIPIERPELEKLSPAEQAAVKAFAEKIDVLNTEQVMNYGSNAQKNISEFSEAALNSVRSVSETPISASPHLRSSARRIWARSAACWAIWSLSCRG